MVSCFTMPFFDSIVRAPSGPSGTGVTRTMSQASSQSRIRRIAPSATAWLVAACFVLLGAPSFARGPASVADVAEACKMRW